MTRRDDTPFDDVFAQIDEMMRRMQEATFGQGVPGDIEEGDGFVGGYSIRQRPGEEPEIRTFGDLGGDDLGGNDGQPSGAAPAGDHGEAPASAPGDGTHVEVHRDDDVVRVVGDFPGVATDDIDLSATPDWLHVEAANDDRSYDETVDLPAAVDPDSAVASYNNGVLEVELSVDEDTNAKDIEIE